MVPRALSDGEVRLRLSTPDDLPFLRRFFDDPEVFEHWGGSVLSDEQISEKYVGARSPAVECFIVDIADQPAGLVQYHQADAGRGGGMDLVLLSEHRGRGVGAAVVRVLARFVTGELGWTRFTVDPDVSNEAGVRFWRNVGFRPVGTVDDDPDRDPYWIMEWRH